MHTHVCTPTHERTHVHICISTPTHKKINIQGRFHSQSAYPAKVLELRLAADTGFLCCSGCKEMGVPENALGSRVSEDLFDSFARAGKMTIYAVTCFVLNVLIITLSYLLMASGFPTPASSAPEPPRHLIGTCQPPAWRPGLLRTGCSPRSPATTPSPPQRTVPCD